MFFDVVGNEDKDYLLRLYAKLVSWRAAKHEYRFKMCQACKSTFFFMLATRQAPEPQTVS